MKSKLQQYADACRKSKVVQHEDEYEDFKYLLKLIQDVADAEHKDIPKLLRVIEAFRLNDRFEYLIDMLLDIISQELKEASQEVINMFEYYAYCENSRGCRKVLEKL